MSGEAFRIESADDWRPEVPEDFQVDEIPLYRPSGEGHHTFVRVEKRLRTSEEVARALACAVGVAPRDVGYAGRKDRFALTRQWYSVPGLDPERAIGLSWPGVRVIEAARHRHKLRTGQLRGNRFEITVRGVADEAAARAADALERLQRVGMPNRFGPQRFGRDGRNADRGRAWLRGEGGRTDRRTARLLVSALQAAVFNAVLAARPAPLDRVETGDVAVVHASGGLFRVEAAERESTRARAFEISATGPIFGTRRLAPSGAPAERERAALAAHGIDPEAPPTVRGMRLRGGRRSLRARPEHAALERSRDALRIVFTLPPGSYASVLVAELFSARSLA
ncbi:MAG: tRNA pseudouridine(13) synthase TruD [Deltaproteobacteria bacterium]|nr:MAG: tRNA pseudouridine(13) synthase TruD [Deltaproteobacteria bacterium]